jgi:glycosyltransferase involved in cell wall biosynthesis
MNLDTSFSTLLARAGRGVQCLAPSRFVSAAASRLKAAVSDLLPNGTARGRWVRAAYRRGRRGWTVKKRSDCRLAQVLQDTRDRKGIVIYPPFIDWTWMRQRPHQLMAYFAKAGYLSLFCSPMYWKDSFRGILHIADRLYVCDNFEQLYDIPNPILLISWTGHWDISQRFHQPVVVYDYLDNLGVSSEEGVPDQLKLALHGKMVANSDIVLATAQELYREVRRVRPDTLYCPNGVDYAHFHDSAEAPAPADIAALVATGRPIIGYYGALARWFDYGLVARAAKARPNYEFLLIGPDFDNTLTNHSLTQLPNVHWLAEKSYEELPAYLHRFTVATIPFLVNDITKSTSPVKLFEYMAARKPIVTTDLPECRQYPCVIVASNAAEYVTMLDEAIRRGKSESYRQLLDNEACGNTWEFRVRQISARLEALAARG